MSLKKTYNVNSIFQGIYGEVEHEEENKEETKLECYKAVALLTLSYGSETLTKMNRNTTKFKPGKKNSIFCDVTLCGLLHMYWHFRETCCLH